MTYYTRSRWGARAPRARYAFGGSDVVGIALHWPAMSTPKRTVDQVKRALRSWQRFHMDTKRWSDIAYQEAIDQDGNVYELRGLSHQSGANGNETLNERYGALLLVLAPGEAPTAAMMSAVRARIARHRELHPSSRLVVGHGQIRPDGTQCPGPITQRLINQGAFEPTTTAPKDWFDMADKNDLKAAIREVLTEKDGVAGLIGPWGKKRSVASVLQTVYNMTVPGKWRDQLLPAADDLADAVAAKLGGSADAAAVKQAVKDAIRELVED